MSELMGATMWIDGDDFVRLLTRLAIDLACAAIVIRLVYARLYQNREYIFTYFLFNVITFCLCMLLRKVPIELGFALGLFAVFGILRYRTEAIRIRDLTYLFIVIGLAILNALANKKISIAELMAVNVVIVGLTAFLELRSAASGQRSQAMFYDNLTLLRPGREGDLHRDLRDRTGLHVVRVDVRRIDMLRDAAEVTVFYNLQPKESTDASFPHRRHLGNHRDLEPAGFGANRRASMVGARRGPRLGRSPIP